ncbi:MAG: translation elongation factor Ts [Planctomycetes bacterium]|nr:translation elongation factor Ts [Planctomycetota bacterium]
MATTEAGFSAKDVMALRRKTGLGMMDCKKAMAQNNGDMAAAEQWLRTKLKGKMAGRTDRETGEGRIGIIVEGSSAAIVEIRTETDFTARNEEFVSMVLDITRLAMTHPAGPVRIDDEITRRIDDVRIKTAENVNFARGEKLEGGSFGTYLHHDGKRAAIIQLDGTADDDVLTGICQHIVAHVPPPVGIAESDVPADRLEQIRDDARREASDSGKPAEIVEKIAKGKVRKFLQQNTLLNQIYVKDPAGKTTVGTLLPAGVSITRFLSYTVGAD